MNNYTNNNIKLMEKELNFRVNYRLSGVEKQVEKLEALGAELEKRGLGRFDDLSGKLIYDDNYEDAVMHLMKKYLLDMEH